MFTATIRAGISAQPLQLRIVIRILTNYFEKFLLRVPYSCQEFSGKNGLQGSSARYSTVYSPEKARRRVGIRQPKPLLAPEKLFYCGTTSIEGEPGTSAFCFPITSPETTISTRRLSLRPAAVLLLATGSALPRPRATTLLMETPEVTR